MWKKSSFWQIKFCVELFEPYLAFFFFPNSLFSLISYVSIKRPDFLFIYNAILRVFFVVTHKLYLFVLKVIAFENHSINKQLTASG